MADKEDEDIDICALRQHLRGEHAFVSKQKRDLQKDYSNVVSTGDSLLRGLWIVGQQWRNLNRLRGGQNFASECAYKSNILDSMHFQDGYATVGFKEVKYGNFLRDLRENTDILHSILILADKCNIDTSAFLRTVVTSLFGSCLFPVDERSFLMVAKGIIKYHLVHSEKPLEIFLRDRNSFVTILDILYNTSLPCRAFFVLACRDVVFDILLDGSLYWTLEEQELLSVMAVQEVRKKFGDPGTAGTTERIKDHMMRCWIALADTVYALLEKIKSSLVCLPDVLMWIISCFYTSSLERGFNEGKARQMVMRFFFNQLLVPLLLRPQPFLIDTEVRASHVANFNLKKVTTIIQTLVCMEAGDDVSYLSPEARQFYENLNKDPLHEIVNNLVEHLPKDSEVMLPDEDSMPGMARTSVLITKTDLDSLVILLCHVKNISSKLQTSSEWHSLRKLINEASLDKLLSNIEDVPLVASCLANMSVSMTNVQDELQSMFQAFNKQLQENENVLVISLGISTIECPGMVQEEKVLGMPTPKVRRRKSTIQDAMVSHLAADMKQTPQLSDSESNESSSDEKPQKPEADKKSPSDSVDSADDVLDGFDDSFVQDFARLPRTNTLDPALYHRSNPVAQIAQVDPFAGFDSVTPILNQNDPFTNVITRVPEEPAQIQPTSGSFTSSEQAPSGMLSSGSRPPASAPLLSPHDQGPLIDFGDLKSSLSVERSSSGVSTDIDSFSSPVSSSTSATSGVTSDEPLFSSGSQSSAGSGKRFSSSASSSSDSGVKVAAGGHVNKEQHVNKKDKKGTRSDVRRKSLKENLQNVITTKVHHSKRNKKKTKTFFRRDAKKNSERLIDTNDVATIIASVENVKTPKVCDEIIQKYAVIQKDRPRKVSSNVATVATHVSRDEEDIMMDAKNKLRLVLSDGSAPVFPAVGSVGRSAKSDRTLLTHLKQDLADAVTNDDPAMIARLHETINTLEKLPSARYPELLRELQKDYMNRKAYLSYLVRSHQGLVGTRQFLEKALERVDRERQICRRYLMTQCVGMFMEGQKEKTDRFASKFERLPMTDEKIEEMRNFIQMIKEEFEQSSLWLGSNAQQRDEACDAIERYVIGRVYWEAVYAFGETDKFRDDVFHESVVSLCNTVGEDFTLLEIKEDFQNEAPWYSAQHELLSLSAFKTPKDKLKCIQRCCTTIMSLLGMSSGDAVGADAFTPVLIYVVMHANPRGLLTTIDFINYYLNETLTGEQYYCWMQFCAAIQFIKILLEEKKSMLSNN